MAEYCLRWNNHQPNLVTVFSELLNAESLVDVTLATDGHFIHAHKLVLSACSVYFKDLFGSNPCKHPIVFLKDIRIEDLKTVIDFIYRGEVNVAQERLQDVLKTAESLRIKGLADKPFNYEDYPSQRSGQHLSSSFSSQRSSLTDSREQQQSAENEDLADGSASSPPVSKKRKVASTQDSSESVQDTNHDNDEQQRTESKESPQKKLGSSTTPSSEDITNKSISSSCSLSIKEKIKEEEEGSEHTSDSRPEYQENQFALLQSRAADAMLLLQRSSSEGGGDEGGSTTPVPPTSNTRDSTSNLISSHTQGNLDWPLSLGHWWASVLPALAQHQHHHTTRPPSLYLPRPTRSQVSPVTPTSLGGGRLPPHLDSGHAGALTISQAWGANAKSGSNTSREGSPASGASPLVVGSLDQLALVSALGKEISPQMVQALQAVASRRESFSSAAKLYSVSVTTLWRYYRKLGLADNTASK